MEIQEIRKRVYDENPLIHGITNPISVNQCANACLAVGARPMMAEHPKEMAEITSSAKALLLNLGSITQTRAKAMKRAARVAKKQGIPVVLDLVGIACSSLRRAFAKRLIKLAAPDILKGNYSEIMALMREEYRSAGVDAESTIAEAELLPLMKGFAQKQRTVLLASGRVDLITDGVRVIRVKNGTPRLASVTGTGCVLGMLATSYLSIATPIEAATTACAILGISGELAAQKSGSGSFLTGLMDGISAISGEVLTEKLRMEER